ncbi:unnamed protein product, partial [marine sediment metagenome]
RMREIEEGEEEGEIPDDLFDFILGHDDVKDVFWKSLNSEEPVHILLVGPPSSSKTMFAGELATPISTFSRVISTARAI